MACLAALSWGPPGGIHVVGCPGKVKKPAAAEPERPKCKTCDQRIVGVPVDDLAWYCIHMAQIPTGGCVVAHEERLACVHHQDFGDWREKMAKWKEEEGA